MKKEMTRLRKSFDLKEFFECKILFYTLKKLTKSITTYVILALSLIVFTGTILSLSKETTITNVSNKYLYYIWVLYFNYFIFAALFIAFKTVQVFREEIEDGTLLIFSSMPYSRVRIIIQKWLALQIVCSIFNMVVLILPLALTMPMSNSLTILTKYAFSNISTLLITAFIIQLFFTSVGLFISLFVSSKGVITVILGLGGLSVVGAIIPMAMNMTQENKPHENYINYVSRANHNHMLLKDYKEDTVEKLFDPNAWPIWYFALSDDKKSFIPRTVSSTSEVKQRNMLIPKYKLTMLADGLAHFLKIEGSKNDLIKNYYKIDIIEMIENFVNDESNAKAYPILYFFFSDQMLIIDQINYDFDSISYSGNQAKVNDVNDSGLNYFDKWYKSGKDKNKPVALIPQDKLDYSNNRYLNNGKPHLNIEDNDEFYELNNMYNNLINQKSITLEKTNEISTEMLQTNGVRYQHFNEYIVTSILDDILANHEEL